MGTKVHLGKMQGKQILLANLRCPVLTDCNVNSAQVTSVKYQQYFMAFQPFIVRKSQSAKSACP